MPNKCKSVFHGLCMSRKAVSTTLRLAILLSVLLTMGGGVERNPGPDRLSAFSSSVGNRKANETESHSLSPAVTRSGGASGVTSTRKNVNKQGTLTYAEVSASPSNTSQNTQDRASRSRAPRHQTRVEEVTSAQLEKRGNSDDPLPESSLPDSRRNTRQTRLTIGEKGEVSVADMNSTSNLSELILSLKHDMNINMASINSQLSSITTTISSLTVKVSDVVSTCESLKENNEKLTKSNSLLQNKVNQLESVIDNLENQSRRSNLIFHGLEGSADETWSTSEDKIRDVLRHDLHLSDAEEIGIERAHRLRRKGNRSCLPVIVKFTSYKGKQKVLSAAKEKLTRTSNVSVREDFSQRIRKHRYELGKHMIEARQNNRFASISYDKLIIDGNVYKYNESDDNLVCVSQRKNSKQTTRGFQRGNRSATTNQNEGDSSTLNMNDSTTHVDGSSTNQAQARAPTRESENTAHAY